MGLAEILSGAKGPPEEGEDVPLDDEETDEGSDSVAFAEDLLAAFEAKDAVAIDDALKAHYEACRASEG